MSTVMLAAQRMGAMGKQPPETIVEEAADTAGVEPDEEQENAAASVAHVAFGAGAGVALALLRSRWPAARGAAPAAAYGLAVYTASYAGWIPALGILPFPTRDDNGRVATMVGAHVVYAVALDALLERVGPEDDEEPEDDDA